jgi:hypothetical protein
MHAPSALDYNARMATAHYAARRKRSQLEHAQMGERMSTYSLALIVGIVVVLLGSAAMIAGSESAGDRPRLMIAIIAIAQLLVSLATLVLVHRSMSAAVRDGEQAEQTARHLRNLTHLVHELKETTRR